MGLLILKKTLNEKIFFTFYFCKTHPDIEGLDLHYNKQIIIFFIYFCYLLGLPKLKKFHIFKSTTLK